MEDIEIIERPDLSGMKVKELLEYCQKCSEDFTSLFLEAWAMSGLVPHSEIKAKTRRAKWFNDECLRVMAIIGQPEVINKLFGDDDSDGYDPGKVEEKVEELLLKVEKELQFRPEYKH